MQAVVVTHPAVSREMLAMAIKQFRRDADALRLLASVINGANQAFDAVLRSRRSADRKGADRTAASLPWGKHTD